MDEPPFALSMRLALPASIIAKGGSFSTVSTLRLYSSTSLACGFSYEAKERQHVCWRSNSKGLLFCDIRNVVSVWHSECQWHLSPAPV
jgi:hypothetical protein